MAQSLLTVRGDKPIASAVSSTERPPKYRNSAMRACRGSISASRPRISSTSRTSAIRSVLAEISSLRGCQLRVWPPPAGARGPPKSAS
jgi:hypothetical protein